MTEATCEEWITLHEASRRCGMTPSAIRIYCRRHDLPIRLGGRGGVRNATRIVYAAYAAAKAAEPVRFRRAREVRQSLDVTRDRAPTTQEIRLATVLYGQWRSGDTHAAEHLTRVVGAIRGGITIGRERVYRDVNGVLRVIPEPVKERVQR